MDETFSKFAYRCLPLSMANAHGWELCCSTSFEAVWDGGEAPGSLRVTSLDGRAPEGSSHFGSGILSFRPEVIFRTPPGFNLWVSGPPNSFKDGVQALSALVETDWMPFPFSMNWKLTRPGLSVRFERGEPYCFLFPLRRGDVEQIDPAIRDLEGEPDLKKPFDYASNRRMFYSLVAEKFAGSDRGAAIRNKRDVMWQGWYMRGEMPDGSGHFEAHQQTLKIKPFEDHRPPADVDGAEAAGPADSAS